MEPTKEQEDQELLDFKVSTELPIDCVSMRGTPNTLEKVVCREHYDVVLHYVKN